MPRFPPPKHLPNRPATVRSLSYSEGSLDRRDGTKRANLLPWMSRAAYLRGWENSSFLKKSKWRMRAHWRDCRRAGDVPRKLTRAERKARYD